METQSLLFARSDEMPEGLYLELMNKLKIDFENKPVIKKEVLIINASLPRYIQIKKVDLIQLIVKESIDWDDREEILLKLTSKISMYDVKSICYNKQIPVTHLNPRWVKQQELIIANQQVNNNTTRVLRNIAPGIMMVPTIPPLETVAVNRF